MAKLNNLRQRSLRCVISEESGTVVKYYKQDSINDVLRRYDEEKMVKVFNPTTEQKQAVIDILDANNNGEEIEVGGVAILKLMEIVTDIEFGDLTEEEALEIVNNPNAILEAVNLELNRMFIDIVKQRYEAMTTLNSLPEPLLKDILEKQIEDMEQEERKRKEEEERKAEIARKRKELQEQLNALEIQ